MPKRISVVAVVLALAAGVALACEPDGRAKAQQACAVCHGVNGLASAPDTPSLAGQPEMYLADQLRAYRSGARRHEVMMVAAKALTDDEIIALARWYSSIKVEARPPD